MTRPPVPAALVEGPEGVAVEEPTPLSGLRATLPTPKTPRAGDFVRREPTFPFLEASSGFEVSSLLPGAAWANLFSLT